MLLRIHWGSGNISLRIREAISKYFGEKTLKTLLSGNEYINSKCLWDLKITRVLI